MTSDIRMTSSERKSQFCAARDRVRELVRMCGECEDEAVDMLLRFEREAAARWRDTLADR